MLKKIKIIVMVLPVLFILGLGRNMAAPRIVETEPKNGARGVNPELTEISVVFNKEMMDKNWSWCYEDKDSFPRITGEPYYTDNSTRCVLPVKLKPHRKYVIWINPENFKNFKDKDGNPAARYRFTFRTK